MMQVRNTFKGIREPDTKTRLLTEAGNDQFHLGRLHNIYKGERGFVSGTGPSLSDMPKKWLYGLREEHIMGVNLILHSNLPFVDTLMAITVSEYSELSAHGSPDQTLDIIHGDMGFELPPFKFYAHERQISSLNQDGWIYAHCNGGKYIDTDFAIHGLHAYLPRVGFGHSVIIPSIQIMAWMGFDPIYLIGCDASDQGHVYADRGDAIDYREPDQGHFMNAALRCEAAFKLAGRTLIDLTPRGQLPITKGDLGMVLNQESVNG